ncbi:efflux RND transporter permease subunit [Desulfobacterales bacterium HSG17]|nr:efflux RND transporter permease subunit [Desulfobacterales bacterium HSG17]
MIKRLMLFSINHSKIAILILLVITLFAVSGLPYLTMDTGLDRLIAKDDPDLPAYARITQEFGSDERILVVVSDAHLWTLKGIQAVELLSNQLSALPFITGVEDLFSLPSIMGKKNRITVKPVLNRNENSPENILQAKKRALANPLVTGNFISPDGSTTIILLSLDPTVDPASDIVHESMEKILGTAREKLDDVFQIGSGRTKRELSQALKADLFILGPISALVLLIAILFFLESFFTAVVPLVTSAVSILWTFGMMGWANIPLNILSAMLPSLILVIGSTEDIHMVAAYFQKIAKQKEKNRKAAAEYMLRHLGVALLLTVATTTAGFASNVFSGISLIRDFALSATFALVANGIITILLVPLLLIWAGPVKTRLFSSQKRSIDVAGWFVKLFGYTNRRFPRVLLLLTGALCSFFLFQLSKLYVTNDPLSYFRADQPLVKDIQRMHQSLNGMKTFFVTLESEKENAFLEPANIALIQKIQGFMEKQNIFDSSISLADFLALVNREFHNGDPKQYKPPMRKKLIAQYLLFFHRHDLERYVSYDYRRANIIVRHKVGDSDILNRHVDELREVANFKAGKDIKVHVVGENLMINAAAQKLMFAQIKSLVILMGVIFLLMSALFTSFKGGFIALIPNLIPIILMFGIMGFLEIPLNPGTVMVAVIAVGLAIDATIHLFTRYNELCRRTSDYEAAVFETLAAEATPMTATSLALALGFGILLLSRFSLVAQFGALSAATMLFAMFANLLITPLIMARVRLVGLNQILTLKVHQTVLDHSPLFDGLTRYQMKKAILISEMRELKKGTLLIEQGTIGRSMYVMLAGTVSVIRRSGDQSQEIVQLKEGDVFGEIGFVNEIERTADVRAITDVSVLRFDNMKIKKDLKLFPYIVARLNFNISCILGQRLAEQIALQNQK